MPKLIHVAVAAYPYFITARTHNGARIFNDPRNADVMRSALYYWRERGRYYLLGFVIMPNHLHVVLQPRGEERVPTIMQSLKGYASRAINNLHGTKGKLWQDGYYDYVLETGEKLVRRIEYMHSNPIRQGLVEDASVYPYSSACQANPTDLSLFL